MPRVGYKNYVDVGTLDEAIAVRYARILADNYIGAKWTWHPGKCIPTEQQILDVLQVILRRAVTTGLPCTTGGMEVVIRNGKPFLRVDKALASMRLMLA